MMTLAMPDSITVGNLPPGYDAYLGYCDGDYPTGPELVRLFPEAHQVILTVTGATTAGCNGCDVEPGNLNAAAARVWVQKKLASKPDSRPVVYASVEGQSNFGMLDVLAALTRNGIGRQEVRLLSAHYGQGPHICGPDSCNGISIEMDGTQWTNTWKVGELETMPPQPVYVDMSMLLDDFFTPGHA